MQSVQERNPCRFFQSTSSGKRCVLLSPEEWKLRKAKLIGYCVNGGGECSLLSNYMSTINYLKPSKPKKKGFF